MPECMEYAKDEGSYQLWDEQDACPAIFAYSDALFKPSDLDEWYVIGLDAEMVGVYPSRDIGDEFRALADKWKEDTWHISSIKKRIAHPAYLKIIGMGQAALPYIFGDLRREPAHWFWALEAITRQDPIPNPENMTQMRNAWLSWAEDHGY
jgi:hypothetical protein